MYEIAFRKVRNRYEKRVQSVHLYLRKQNNAKRNNISGLL